MKAKSLLKKLNILILLQTVLTINLTFASLENCQNAFSLEQEIIV